MVLDEIDTCITCILLASSVWAAIKRTAVSSFGVSVCRWYKISVSLASDPFCWPCQVKECKIILEQSLTTGWLTNSLWEMEKCRPVWRMRTGGFKWLSLSSSSDHLCVVIGVAYEGRWMGNQAGLGPSKNTGHPA